MYFVIYGVAPFHARRPVAARAASPSEEGRATDPAEHEPSSWWPGGQQLTLAPTKPAATERGPPSWWQNTRVFLNLPFRPVSESARERRLQALQAYTQQPSLHPQDPRSVHKHLLPRTGGATRPFPREALNPFILRACPLGPPRIISRRVHAVLLSSCGTTSKTLCGLGNKTQRLVNGHIALEANNDTHSRSTNQASRSSGISSQPRYAYHTTIQVPVRTCYEWCTLPYTVPRVRPALHDARVLHRRGCEDRGWLQSLL